MTKGLWCGKPLESYSKEGLIEIICTMDRLAKIEKEWHDEKMRIIDNKWRIIKLITR